MRGRQRAGEGCELPKRNLYGLLMAETEPLWGIAGNLYGARDLASHCFYRGGAEPLWAIPQDSWVVCGSAHKGSDRPHKGSCAFHKGSGRDQSYL